MKKYNFNSKIIATIFFVIIFLSTSPARSLDKFYKADSISNYFSGILLLNENQYDSSFNYLKKLNGLETRHTNFSVQYLYSLVNSGNFKEAFKYSKKLEKQKIDNFESRLITGVFYLRNSDLASAQKYFLKAKNRNSQFILNNYVSESLYNWSSVDEYEYDQASLNLEALDKRFKNLKKIQNVFLNCFFDKTNTNELYKKLTLNDKTDFSRYHYFHASYLVSLGKSNDAKFIIKSALETYPRNLLLNQYKIDLNEKKNNYSFDCKKKEHVIAEILYITANALASQSIYQISNFYLNLAKYLNKSFYSYNTLLAENFYETNNFNDAKKIYKNLSEKGSAFHWYSSKQLARILIKEENKKLALELVSEAFVKLNEKDIYQIFDYAEFLKNNEKFEESITYYSKILSIINNDHPLYAAATDGRGVAFEREGEWDKAEKDLLSSLKANPDQAYVINYLAYSWIEKGVKIEKSLAMLEKANKLKSNDPFIIDSLGWALFKLERYKESKNYLQQAVKLMPGDPIVNDHYGDVLWKNGNKIQARYYWKYVLKLEKTEDILKETIENKLIKGL